MSIFDSHSRKAFYLVKQFRIGDCAMCIGAIFFLILFDFGLKLFLKTISQFSRKQDSKRIQNRSINSFLRHLRVKQVTCFCFVFNFCLLQCFEHVLNMMQSKQIIASLLSILSNKFIPVQKMMQSKQIIAPLFSNSFEHI